MQPAGTAIRADRLVLVTTPMPWPKPATAHPWLAPLAAALEAAPDDAPRTRLLAVAPGGAPRSAQTAASNRVEVRVYERVVTGEVQQHSGTVAVDELDALAIELVNGNGPLLTSDEVQPVLLVCTQGSHDVCCGSLGTSLVAELEDTASDWGQPTHRGQMEILRASHVGGHKFAPTALSLPDGRMWAYLDEALTREIMDHPTPIPSAALAERNRGWWGAEAGPAQVAEAAVFASQGWEIDNQKRSVSVIPAEATASPTPAYLCTVHAGSHQWEVDVVVSRYVPTVSCRVLGGQPAKVAAEYAVLGVRRSSEAKS